MLFVFDVADRSTFESLDRWLQEAKDNGCDLSERSIKYSAGMGAPTTFVVAGNKVDQPDRRRQVSEAEAEAWASAHGAVYFETSAKSGANGKFREGNVAR